MVPEKPDLKTLAAAPVDATLDILPIAAPRDTDGSTQPHLFSSNGPFFTFTPCAALMCEAASAFVAAHDVSRTRIR